MRRSGVRKLSAAVMLLGATLFYGCGQNPSLQQGWNTGMVAGCAPISGPIAFSGQNVQYTPTFLVGQNIPAGNGGIGLTPIAAGIPTQGGMGPSPMYAERISVDGTKIAFNVQSNGTNGMGMINGVLTLSQPIQNSLLARYGTGQFPGQAGNPVAAGALCVQSISLQGSVNAAAGSPDQRFFGPPWIQVTLQNGHGFTMSL